MINKISGVVNALTGFSNSIFGGLNELITSPEELGKVKALIQSQLQQFQIAMEGELTSRHSADMQSDSWLSKNIRPITLAGVTLIFLVFAVGDFVAPMYIDLLGNIMSLVYGFYFGGRTIEKAVKMFTNKKEDKKK